MAGVGGARHRVGEQFEPHDFGDAQQDEIRAWFESGGVPSPVNDGIHYVHAGSQNHRLNKPLSPPLWPSTGDQSRRYLEAIGYDGEAQDRRALKRWLWSMRKEGMRTRLDGTSGYGALVYRSRNPIIYNLRTFPQELIRHRDVMQCVRLPGATNRLNHQIDTGYTQALIATQAGLSEWDVVNNFVAGSVHDAGHLAFAHSSEHALQQFFPDWYGNHAHHSGLIVASFSWPEGSRHDHKIIADASWGHSWALPSMYEVDPASGFLADMAGIADRISYSITDICDAIRSGRLQWEDLPIVMPQTFAYMGLKRKKVKELIELGFERGFPYFQARLRNVLVADVASNIRNRGFVAIGSSGAKVLAELRANGPGRMFCQPDHKDVERKITAMCLTVLQHLEKRANKAHIEGREAKLWAIGRFSQMSEDQVLDYATRNSLPLSFIPSEFAEGGKSEFVSFRPDEARFTPVGAPEGFRPISSENIRKPRNQILPISKVLNVSFEFNPRRFGGDVSGSFVLNCVETLEMLNVLSSRCKGPIPYKLPTIEGAPIVRLPRAGTEKHSELKLELQSALAEAVDEVLGSQRDDPSIRTLRELAEKYPRDMGSLLTAYDQFSRGFSRPDVDRGALHLDQPDIPTLAGLSLTRR